jgi:Diacylglycerol kinase catalytic domain
VCTCVHVCARVCVCERAYAHVFSQMKEHHFVKGNLVGQTCKHCNKGFQLKGFDGVCCSKCGLTAHPGCEVSWNMPCHARHAALRLWITSAMESQRERERHAAGSGRSMAVASAGMRSQAQLDWLSEVDPERAAQLGGRGTPRASSSSATAQPPATSTTPISSTAEAAAPAAVGADAIPEEVPPRPLLVFVNSRAGGGQGVPLLHKLRKLLSVHQVVDLSDGGPDEALQRFRSVPDLHVMCAGGDGTVGWILSRIDALGITPCPPVAILPLGTGNDLVGACGQ